MGPRFRLARRTPPPFPWRRPRHELALVALVALATLTFVYRVNAQDISRICLSRSLIHLHVSADGCLGGLRAAVDKSGYGGHLYSDKAPGMSVLEVPGVALARVPPAREWPGETIRVWVPRVLSSGIAFLVCLLLVGRMSEGLAPGYGGVSLVTFGLGTLFAPLAATNFEHVTAGTLGLGALALAWSRRPLLAGLLGGAAVLVAYELTMVTLVVGAYVALQGGRALARYALGVIPGVALLLAYNWVAFGRPWHFSYRYVLDRSQGSAQSAGFFGIHVPHAGGIREVFVGDGGVLVTSPVLVAASVGLVLLGRRYGAEAIVCVTVTLLFVLLNCGYYLPYGGLSPGPRFLVPCLPFLALGLGPAFRALPRPTAVLAVLSVVAMVAVAMTWVSLGAAPAGSIWNAIVHFPVDRPRILENLSSNLLKWAHVSSTPAWLLAPLAAVAALALSLTDAFRRGGPPVGESPSTS